MNTTNISLRDQAEDATPSLAKGSATPAQRGQFLSWVGRLVHKYRASLARIARREGLTPDDAFDAVQDALHTFITLPQARSLVDEDDQSRKLLVTLTRNASRNRRRLHALARPHDTAPEALERIPTDTATVEEILTAAEEQLRLATCIRTLEDVPRAIVTLRMLDDVAGEDVARILRLTPGHVAVLLHRAKANLLACMTR